MLRILMKLTLILKTRQTYLFPFFNPIFSSPMSVYSVRQIVGVRARPLVRFKQKFNANLITGVRLANWLQ